MENKTLDNPLVVPERAQLPHLRRLDAAGEGPDAVSRSPSWPDNIPLLYYAYHIMVGLGTIFIADHGGRGIAALARRALRVALDAVGPDAERSVSVHRQHRRLDDGRIRTPALAGLWPDAHRRRLLEAVSAGNAWFTLLGFMGMYTCFPSCSSFWCSARLSTARWRTQLSAAEVK